LCRRWWLGRWQEDDDAVVAANLKVCTVKQVGTPDVDRRFCFQVVSPARTYTLQGLSDDDVQQWVTILQAAIGAALSAPASTSADDGSANEMGVSRDKKVRFTCPCPEHTGANPRDARRVHDTVCAGRWGC
jgi:hypothetical protein